MVSVVDAADVGDEKAPEAPLTLPPPEEAPPAPFVMFVPLRLHWNETLENPLAGDAVSVRVCPAHDTCDEGETATAGAPVIE